MAKVDIMGVGGGDISIKEILILAGLAVAVIYIVPKLAGAAIKNTASAATDLAGAALNAVPEIAEKIVSPANPVNRTVDVFYKAVTGSEDSIGEDTYDGVQNVKEFFTGWLN